MRKAIENMEKCTIRVAKIEDAEELLAIYAPYVKNTAISFEYDVPSLEEFQGRMNHILQKYPYLVAERDGEIVGYTQMLNEARQIAIKRMVDEAKELGADAVIDIKYGSSQIMAGAAEVIAYGTAVKYKNK